MHFAKHSKAVALRMIITSLTLSLGVHVAISASAVSFAHSGLAPETVDSPSARSSSATQIAWLPKNYDRGRGGSVSVSVVFGERDREIIREYCSQSSNLPPGLAKRGGQLPPGLEKHLRRNGQLPPGLQKKVGRFPTELDGRLSRLPRNYARLFIAGRALIVDAQFNIMDIIEILR
jgi:hypothetical protein